MSVNLSLKIFWKSVLLFAGIAYSAVLPAQNSVTDSTNNAIAISNAINAYHQFLSPQTSLYKGSEYVDYAYTITEGTPFFETSQFRTGSVVYDGILYENVPLLYDEVIDELVLANINGGSKIKLNKESVAAFNLLNHHFVKLDQDSSGKSPVRSGFYDLLYEGSLSVYKKQTKKVMERVTFSLGLERIIDEQNAYFIKQGKSYYPINTRRDALNLVKDKKKEIQQFLKKNRLSVRRSKEIALIKMAAYYDQLTSK